MAIRKRKLRTKARSARPYLMAALFCEKLLVDKDNVMSPIRIVDIIAVPKPGPMPKPAEIPAILLTLLVAFKAGDVRGSRRLIIRMNVPSGKRRNLVDAQMEFLGDEKGAALRSPAPIDISEEGLYWYDVILEKSLITRMPLRVVHQQKPQTPEPASHAERE